MQEVSTGDAEHGGDSAGSWQTYLSALKIEGRRYRPASLRDRPSESERRPDGNPGNAPTKAEADGAAKMKALFRRYGWRIQGGNR
jgi:hypothetical protein